MAYLLAWMGMDDFEMRFGGLSRLYGKSVLPRLRAAHVAVIGLGGVGTWTAEALARSGVGALTLVDLDEICVTNINRQLPALTATVGLAKVKVMAERIDGINSQCRVVARQEFFNQDSASSILTSGIDFVVDAIDSVPNKALLLVSCRDRHLPVVSVGAAGGRRQPTAVKIADLARVSHDRLLGEVRKRLRRDFGFPPVGSPMHIDCIFSSEPPVFPQADGTIGGTRCVAGAEPGLNCNAGFGSAAFVTGAFGLAAAAVVVEKIAAR